MEGEKEKKFRIETGIYDPFRILKCINNHNIYYNESKCHQVTDLPQDIWFNVPFTKSSVEKSTPLIVLKHPRNLPK
jgi:hypothetical protein